MRRRRIGRRVVRRTARRVGRRQRRRFRRRILVGGAVLLAVGSAAHGAVKLTQKDATNIEQHTNASVEELSEEELLQAMKDLGIESIEITDKDKTIISKEGNP